MANGEAMFDAVGDGRANPARTVRASGRDGSERAGRTVERCARGGL